MGMGFASTWLRQVSPPPLHKTTLTTDEARCLSIARRSRTCSQSESGKRRTKQQWLPCSS